MLGVLFLSQDLFKIASYIEKLLAERSLRDQMGSKSRELALKEHDRNLFFKLIVSRMKDIVGT